MFEIELGSDRVLSKRKIKRQLKAKMVASLE
jgi:hypothetical protein